MGEHEVICIHIGQAGIQMGNASWELIGLEHGIKPDGLMVDNLHGNDNSFRTFYMETGNAKFVPRSIFVDLESTVVDEIRTGTYRNLFHPDNLITGKEDAANNYARGYYTVGAQMIDKTIDQVRTVVENCHFLQGFVIVHSLGGGTGSGFCSNLIRHLSNEYKKQTKIELIVYPSPKLTSAVVEPYNSVLATHSCIEESDVVFVVNNEAIWNIIRSRLNIKRPSFTNINRLLAQIISSLTAPLRFQGSLKGDLTEFQTNLVPYPRIHFPLTTFNPIVSAEKANYEQNTIDQITRSCFEPSNCFVNCNLLHGLYMAVCMLYRGDIDPATVNSSIQAVRQSNRLVRFVDWCPTGFKVDINYQPMQSVPRSELARVNRTCCMLANNTAVCESFSNINSKFDLMYHKRAFIHWFVGEGLDRDEFTFAREDLADLEKDYYEIAPITGA